MAAAGWPQGAQHSNLITQDLSSGEIVRLPGSVHRLVQRSADLGEVDPAMQLDLLTLHFGLSAEQQIEMDALSQAQQDPKSPQYHQWLTQEEYGKRFGLTDADLKQVTQWLQAQGFRVRDVSKSRNAVRFSGQAWQVEAAFHTQLHRYQLNGEEHFANATELQIPAGLRGVLLAVRGLNNFRPKPQLRRQSATPDFTVNTNQGLMNFLAPGDWATIYHVNDVNGVPGIYSQPCVNASGKCDGTGAFVGVVGQTFLVKSGVPVNTDIDHFRKAALLGPTKLTLVCTEPGAAACTGAPSQGDLGEADLDIEWSGGIAKNATVVYVYTPLSAGNVFDALTHAVMNFTVPATGQVLPVISMSYLTCEQDTATANSLDSLGAQANLQGQTIVVASGDQGVAECDLSTDYPAKDGASAPVPADSPHYTGVGGTRFDEGGSPSTFWNETVNGQGLGQVNSALSYIPEIVWNDTTPVAQCTPPNANCELAASGSGVSSLFNPLWSEPIAGQTKRLVPDVSFAASPNHDGYTTCSSDTLPVKDCATGFVGSDGSLDIIGGTSAGTPSFAGMLTLLVQKYGAQGNINPTLYQMASVPATYTAVFHDITSGNNKVPCVFGTTGCIGGSAGVPGTMGFTATGGYDLATGLGSINGGALFQELAPLNPGITLGANPSTVTQSAGSAPVPIMLTVTGARTGFVHFSCSGLPAKANCIFSSSALAPGAGPVTMTITTTAPAAAGPPAGLRPGPMRGPLYAVTLALAALLLATMMLAGQPAGSERRKRLGYGFASLLLAGCLLQTACGGGGGGGGGGGNIVSGTPKGTFTVTVNAVAGSIQASTQVMLTVQ